MKKKYLWTIIYLLTPTVIFLLIYNSNFSFYRIISFWVRSLVLVILFYISLSSIEKLEGSKVEIEKPLYRLSNKTMRLWSFLWLVFMLLIALSIFLFFKPELGTAPRLVLSFLISTLIIIPSEALYFMYKSGKKSFFLLLYLTVSSVFVLPLLWILSFDLNNSTLKMISVVASFLFVYFLLGLSIYCVYVMFRYSIPSIAHQQKIKSKK